MGKYDSEYYRRVGYNSQKKWGKAYNVRTRLAIFALLGNKCIRCNFSDTRALQIDHINGGGAKERKSITGNYHKYVLQKIINGDTSYQLLCANCNWIKKYENNESPNLNKNIYE